MADPLRILVLNPGSTSTKVALYEEEEETAARTLTHATESLAQFSGVIDQEPFRAKIVEEFVDRELSADRCDAVIGRGGLLKPLVSGVYRVSPAMLDDLRSCTYGEHASNLGAILARRLAERWNCEAFIADPVVVDEMDPESRLSGIPEISRRSIFHALNQKSAAREVARNTGTPYEELNLIVAHLGGGISVGAHHAGRVIDVNNALDGDGPFSPERAGGLPVAQVVDLAQTMPVEQFKRHLVGTGGLVAYCGTNNLQEVCERAQDGDETCRRTIDAMVLQIGQEIAKHGATLFGSVDGIVLTGGMAHDERVVDDIRERVAYLGPVYVIPGERELLSLARAALSALRREVPVREY